MARSRGKMCLARDARGASPPGHRPRRRQLRPRRHRDERHRCGNAVAAQQLTYASKVVEAQMLSSSGVRSSHRPPESRTHSWAAAAACRASRYADRAPTAPPVSASSITPARSCDTDANGDEDRQSAHLMRRAISQAEACNHQRPSAPSAECAPRRQARSGTHGAARTGRRRCGSKTQGASSPAGHAVAERSAPPPPPSTSLPTYPSPPPSTPTPHSSPPSARALGHRPEGQTRMVRLELPAVPRDCTMACRQRRRRLERVWSGTRRSRGRWPAGVITVSILH